jgi:hypothetical protein
MFVNGSGDVSKNDFPVVVIVALAGLLLGCGQDRDGPLRVEGKLLLGHAQQVRVSRGRPTNR